MGVSRLKGETELSRLIFFCGHAGTGKTTLAKQLISPLIARSGQAYCLLDKDTLYGRHSAAAMGALTGDPNDRDSPLYLQHFRDREYQGLLDTARENLALGVNVIVVGPFSREIKEHRLIDHHWLDLPTWIDIRIIWVYVAEDLARERILERANPNDAYKLAHWQEYRKRRFEPMTTVYPELLMFDNTEPASSRIEALTAQLLERGTWAANVRA